MLLATPPVEKLFQENGIMLDDKIDTVVITFDQTINYEKLTRPAPSFEMAATSSLPTQFQLSHRGWVYTDYGAMCAFITASTGKNRNIWENLTGKLWIIYWIEQG